MFLSLLTSEVYWWVVSGNPSNFDDRRRLVRRNSCSRRGMGFLPVKKEGEGLVKDPRDPPES